MNQEEEIRLALALRRKLVHDVEAIGGTPADIDRLVLDARDDRRSPRDREELIHNLAGKADGFHFIVDYGVDDEEYAKNFRLLTHSTNLAVRECINPDNFPNHRGLRGKIKRHVTKFWIGRWWYWSRKMSYLSDQIAQSLIPVKPINTFELLTMGAMNSRLSFDVNVVTIDKSKLGHDQNCAVVMRRTLSNKQAVSYCPLETPLKEYCTIFVYRDEI